MTNCARHSRGKACGCGAWRGTVAFTLPMKAAKFVQLLSALHMNVFRWNPSYFSIEEVLGNRDSKNNSMIFVVYRSYVAYCEENDMWWKCGVIS